MFNLSTFHGMWENFVKLRPCLICLFSSALWPKQQNRWKKCCKFCEYCEMVTTFHQILSFYIVPWPAKIQVHWVNGTLRNCERTGLALSTPALSAFQLFLWIFSTPGLPFTTASLVIYGNPCGMQDGYSIFIENYQSEDLGSIHRRSKPSLHLPDSFRLKISENLWKSRHKNLPEILRNCFFLHKGSYWSRSLSTPGWHSQLDIRRITMSLSWLRRLFSIHCHVSIQHMLGLNWVFF